ncbi:MAG: WYL domain-containing protein [Planctomycetota bacterium]|jgi:predicted DNA-binding transcriptional regulator YafY|nr:WYL domain-containing protein [Planctomycetota bacterium]
MTRSADSSTLTAQLQAANDLPASRAGHTPLAERLAALLQRLSNGECLKIDETLAVEFGVNTRTLQRDIASRLSFLPLEKTKQGYFLDPRYLGTLKPKDIRDFATLAGVSGLFPALDDGFIRDLFDRRLADTLSIQGPAYEDLRERKADFRKLQQAIGERWHLRFTYENAQGGGSAALPPRQHHRHLVSLRRRCGRRTTQVLRLRLVRLEKRFTQNREIAERLAQEDSQWLKQDKTEAVLKVSAPAAIYFRRRSLIAQQKTIKELEDGGLIVSGKFAHPNQILPIVRYWIPHVVIVSPEEWRKTMEAGLRDYLEE